MKALCLVGMLLPKWVLIANGRRVQPIYKGGRLTQRAKGKHSRTGILLKAGINRKRFLV